MTKALPPQTPGASAVRRSESRPSGVLIIDDEALICSLVSDTLTARGYTVWQASSAKRALELINAQGPKIGLILLDVVMPGTDGLTFLGTLRRLSLAADEGRRLACVSKAFGRACRILGLRHIRPRPSTPRTNGKAERLIQTL